MRKTQTDPKKQRNRIAAAEIHKQPTIRFQVEMLRRRLPRIGLMMAKTGLRTKREFFDYAFTIFELAIEETAVGNTVRSLTPKSVFRSLETPPLKNVQGYEEKDKPQNERTSVTTGTINGTEKTTERGQGDSNETL